MVILKNYFKNKYIHIKIIKACEQIKERLIPLKEKYPKKSFEELIVSAYQEKISLGEKIFLFLFLFLFFLKSFLWIL